MFQKMFRFNVFIDFGKIVLMHKLAPKSAFAYKRSLGCCKPESDILTIAQRLNAGSLVIGMDRVPIGTEEICIHLQASLFIASGAPRSASHFWVLRFATDSGHTSA